MRAMCGSTRPTKPMAPLEATTTAVSRAVSTSSVTRVRRTATPSEAAWRSPKVKASSEPAMPRASTMMTAKPAAVCATSVQEALAREPMSQYRTPRVVFASAPTMMMNEVSAEKPCVTATPASTILSVVPPASPARASMIANAPRAPTKAPPDRPRAEPTPSTRTRTAPVEAPEETPSR